MAEAVKEQSLFDKIVDLNNRAGRFALETVGIDVDAANKALYEGIGSVSSLVGSEEVKVPVTENTSAQKPEADIIASPLNKAAVEPAAIDPEIQKNIMTYEQGLKDFIPYLNTLPDYMIGFGLASVPMNLKPEQSIEQIGSVDGVFEQKSLDSSQKVIQHLNYLLELDKTKSIGTSKHQSTAFDPNNADDMKKMFLGKVGEVIAEKKTELNGLQGDDRSAAEAEIVKLENFRDKSIPQTIDAMVYLQGKGVLDGTVTLASAVQQSQTQINSSNQQSQPSGTNNQAQGAQQQPSSSQGNEPTEGEIVLSTGIIEGLLFAAGSKIKDFDKFGLSASIVTPLKPGEVGGEFGANSQDMLAKAIVLVKKLEGETNPNGEYSQAVGQQLKKAILTNPDLEMLRTELKIPLMDEATAKRYFGGAPLGSDAAAIGQHAVWKQNVEDQPHIKELDNFIWALDTLHAADQLDTENKAKSTTAANVVMDGMHMAMKKWAPGLMDMLQDFFNSDFGKMLAPILAMFGINVNRMFGDKSDPDPETLVPLVGNGFDLFYEAAAEELGDGAVHADIMLKTKENIMGSMDGNIAFDAAMNLLFKDKGDAYIENIVENALDNALKESNPADARYAFSKSLLAAGQQYANGQDLDIAQINALLDQATKNMNDVDKELAAAVTKSLNQPAVATVTVKPEAEDDNSIAVNDKHQITLISTPDTTIYDQDPMRYAPEMVKAIQQGLISAHADLGLSTKPENMMKADGSLTEVFDMGTNKMLQELLLRAQVHDHIESNSTITQADLDGFERKLTLENIAVVEDYMKAKGVSDADFQKISGNLRELGDDFKSIDPNNSNEGEPVKDSVLIQSLVPASLFDLKLEDLALKQEVKKAPTPKVIPSIGGYKATEAKAEEQKPEEPETIVAQYNRVAQAGLPPVSFKTLNKLTPEQSKYFRDEKLDLDKVFDDKIGIKEGSSTYYLLEPEKYGIMNSGVDMIVAMRDGYKVDIRGINYEQDKISPISLNGGARSVDSILTFIDKPNGGSIRQGVASGVGGMYVLAPNSENNSRGVHLEKGTQYFFGNDARAYNAPQIKASGSKFEAFRPDSGASKSEPIVVADNKTYYPGQDTLKGWTGVGNRWIKTFNGASGAIGGLFESDPKAAIEQNSSDMSTNDASGKFEAGDFPKFTGHDPFDDGNNAWSNSNAGGNGGL